MFSCCLIQGSGARLTKSKKKRHNASQNFEISSFVTCYLLALRRDRTLAIENLDRLCNFILHQHFITRMSKCISIIFENSLNSGFVFNIKTVRFLGPTELTCTLRGNPTVRRMF